MQDSLRREVQLYNGLSELSQVLNEDMKRGSSNLQYIKEQTGGKNRDLLSFLIKFAGVGGYEYSSEDLTALVKLLSESNAQAAAEAFKEAVGCIKQIKENEERFRGANIIRQGGRLRALSTIVCCLVANTDVLRSQTLVAYQQGKALNFLFATTASMLTFIENIFIAHSEALRLENFCTALSISLRSDSYYRNTTSTQSIVHKDSKMHALHYMLQSYQSDLAQMMKPLEYKLHYLLKCLGCKFSGSALRYIMQNEDIKAVEHHLVIPSRCSPCLAPNAIENVLAFLHHHAKTKSDIDINVAQ